MPRRRRRLTPETIEEIKRLRGEGMPVDKIARKLKLGVSTVYRHLQTGKREGFFERLKRKLGLK